MIDRFPHPRNAGLMRGPDAVGEQEYEGCGDLARFRCERGLGSPRGRFQTWGSGPTIAAGTAARELVAGYTLVAGYSMGARPHMSAWVVEDGLDGLPDDRRHGAGGVAGALWAAAGDYPRRQESHVRLDTL